MDGSNRGYTLEINLCAYCTKCGSPGAFEIGFRRDICKIDARVGRWIGAERKMLWAGTKQTTRERKGMAVTDSGLPVQKKPKRGRTKGTDEGGREDGIRQQNVALILKAATSLFSRKGYEGTRIAEVADIAGLPKANVYYYFSSKEEIYDAVIKQLLDGWDAAFKAITPDADPRQALERYVRSKLEHARKHSEESRVFAGEIIGGARFLRWRDRHHMRQVTQTYSAVVEGWIAAGKMKPVDPRHLFIMLWAATQFYGDFPILACDALGRSRLSRADFDAAAKVICATVLDSLIPSDAETGVLDSPESR
ncbi:MAG: TetR family transcriptional regulator C-terminal domain-containing protein [Ancalomicrobiaceae bacterium]|nr:TetR family transcriptional regulator C-terminal domain-containing protein [Ancalomicrobiaceae bacterium]